MNDGNFLFQCPNCGHSFDCGELMPGHDWQCPTCGRIFSVQEDNGQQEESDEGRDEDVETMGNEVPKEDSPVFSDKTNKEPSIKGKVMQIPEVAKTAVVNAFRHAKAAFLRLPRRVRWSVVASLVILAGIAFTLGHGSKVDDANNESHETSVAVASPAGNNASAKKPLSDAAKHQMAIAFVAPTVSSVMRERLADSVHSEMEKKAERRRTAFTDDEEKEVKELIDFTNAGVMVEIWSRLDLAACPQEFRDEWKRAVDHFSANSAARFSVDLRKLFRAAATIDLEWWRKTKKDIRRRNGSYPNFRSTEDLIEEMSKMILSSIASIANESDLRYIVASSLKPDIVDAAHKAMCAAGDGLLVFSTEQSQSRNSGGKDSATPEALCDEFASGGSHFVRTSATTVWWDVGGETPRFTCEVTFLPGGMARLTQDNTFYAYEEKNRSTNPQILARRLQQSYSQFCRDNYEIKNVKAFATSDGRLLFSGEIPVERGNVSKQIGKVFSALNEARIASRL